MSKAQAVILIGAGGHARVLLDVLGRCGVAVAGLTDVDAGKHGKLLAGVRVLGSDEVLGRHPPAKTILVNAMGSAESMSLRQKVYERLKKEGYRFLTLVHPSAVIAPDAVLGEGVQVMAGAIVQPGVKIDANSILNTGAQVDHDCLIGAHVHLAPGATLSGSVTVGDGTHIGTAAAVVQCLRVGRGCLVGAGAVVTEDVADGERVAGVPARRIGK
ncbi:MAG TPA: acetyltransferase [Burkholderiales bacterium]|nr:acetyltransferase [Burkholderiales bacterium]